MNNPVISMSARQPRASFLFRIQDSLQLSIARATSEKSAQTCSAFLPVRTFESGLFNIMFALGIEFNPLFFELCAVVHEPRIKFARRYLGFFKSLFYKRQQFFV